MSARITRRGLLRTAAGSGVAFSVLGLAACQQTPAPTPTATPAPAKPTTAPAAGTTPAAAASPAAQPKASTASGAVRWQHRGADYEIKASQEYIDKIFTPANPNIKVTIEPAPDGRDEKLITAMVGGNAPDVFETWSDNVTQFADRGQVVDVESLVKRDMSADDLKDFYEWQWKDFSIPTSAGGKIRFGLPKYVNIMVIWYNKDMFDQAGVKYPDDSWTHDTYREAAIKLTKKTGNTVESFGLQYPVWSWDRYWYKIEAWGGTVIDPSDNTKATFDSDIALEALEWSRKLMWDDKAMAQQLLLLGTGTTFDARDLFAAKRFVMSEDGFYPFRLAQSVKKQFKWAFAHTPPGKSGKRRVLGTTDGWSLWKNSKTQDAAWEVMKGLAGKDHQNAQSTSSGRLPVRYTALKEWKDIVVKAYPELSDANLDVGPKAMEMGYPGNRAFFKKDADARQLVVPALEKVFITGNTPVTYFKEIAQQVTAKMRA